jgi:predicted small lipoprotein YifL
MARPFATLLLGLGLVAGLACGRKGPLELPPGREPAAVEGLAAFQRGDTVVLEWTNPVKAVSGRPLAGLDAVEVWVFDRGRPAGGRAPSSAEVDKEARLLRRIPQEDLGRYQRNPGERNARMVFAYAFITGAVVPKSLAFSVRALDAKKRASEFAVPAVVDIKVCPRPPHAETVTVFAEFVELRWTAPEANIDGSSPANVAGYAVYRAEGNDQPRELTAAAVGLKFEDRDFAFGTTYTYFVRAVAAGTGGAVESGDSESLTTTPRDIFPPAAPSGLAVLAAEGLVSLSWRPGAERDLEGYRVWRREDVSPDFVPLGGGLIREIAFTDASMAKGRTYLYAVSAVDTAGNESPRSEAVAVVAKGARS